MTLTYSEGIAITKDKTRTIDYTATENYSGVVIADSEETTVTENTFLAKLLVILSKVIAFFTEIISSLTK